MATCSELSDMDLAEDYKSPFDFNSGVDRNYLYLSPGINLSPPGSPTLTKPGNVLLSVCHSVVWEAEWLVSVERICSCEGSVAGLKGQHK